MLFKNVRVVAMAHVEPPIVVTSAELDARLEPTYKRLGIGPGFIEGLTGISERRFWGDGVPPSDGAAEAGRRALAASGVDPSRIGILINASVTRDYVEPSTACIIHAKIGLPELCQNFDVSNACLGFIDGMDVAGAMIEQGIVDYALVVNSEAMDEGVQSTMRRLLDPNLDEPTFRLQFASLTLGSGAVAMVLGHARNHPEGHVYRGAVNVAATQHANLCRAQKDWMETDTKGLLIAGLELAFKTWQRAQAELGWTADVLDAVALHQVSKTHTTRFLESIGVPQDRACLTFPKYGNIGPASVPFALSKAAAEGQFQKGQRVALMGIGSGLNCKMAELVW